MYVYTHITLHGNMRTFKPDEHFPHTSPSTYLPIHIASAVRLRMTNHAYTHTHTYIHIHMGDSTSTNHGPRIGLSSPGAFHITMEKKVRLTNRHVCDVACQCFGCLKGIFVPLHVYKRMRLIGLTHWGLRHCPIVWLPFLSFCIPE